MSYMLLPILIAAQAAAIPFTDVASMKAIGVKGEAVTYKGRKAVRVTDALPPNSETPRRMVIVPKVEMMDGTIEIDVAGDVAPGAQSDARGFVGVAFHVNPDATKYETLYLRPTNGRAEDQVRRNHSVQYEALPDFPWFKLRKEFPEKYETYVDLVPGEWTKVRIELSGTTARLFINGVKQPSFIVTDLKYGATSGGIGLWIGVGTMAHFSNLRITPPPSHLPPAPLHRPPPPHKLRPVSNNFETLPLTERAHPRQDRGR